MNRHTYQARGEGKNWCVQCGLTENHEMHSPALPPASTSAAKMNQPTAERSLVQTFRCCALHWETPWPNDMDDARLVEVLKTVAKVLTP